MFRFVLKKQKLKSKQTEGQKTKELACLQFQDGNI